MASGLITTAHEIGIALVLPVLSTIAVASVDGDTLEGAVAADPGALAAGFGDAFTAAAAITGAAAVLALVGLRRKDVPLEEGHAAFAH